MKIRLSPVAFATSIHAFRTVLGTVRVEGWIKAPDKASGFEASNLLGGLFGLDHAGGFSLDGTFTDFSFSFDVRPDFVPRAARFETRAELLDRVERTLKNASARLTRERNAKLAGFTEV